MFKLPLPSVRSVMIAAALGVATVALTAAPSPAQARVFIGVGIGVPYFYGPGYYPAPYYYPPPYYPAPPVVYAPPQTTYTPSAAPASAGQSCYAGPYVCPMDRPVPSGANCYCPGNGGERVNGRAS